MYTHIDAVEIAEERAVTFAMRDREKYFPFFKAAETFAAENNLIVGDKVATLMLTGGELGINDYSYTFYSGNAVSDTRALTLVLYEQTIRGTANGSSSGRQDSEDFYVYMTTDVPGEKFTIRVDERPLFTVLSLRTKRNTPLKDVFVPSQAKGFFVPERLLCLGPELQLIQVYTALCDPSLAGSWGDLLDTEAKLRALLLKEMPKKLKEIVGGAPPSPQMLVKKLYKDFAGKGSRVLLDVSDTRIRVVTANDLGEDEKVVREIAKKMGFVQVDGVRNNPSIPGSPRLTRLTMYIQYKGRQVSFLDVYDAGRYELVPFVVTPSVVTGGGKKTAKRRRDGRKPRPDVQKPPRVVKRGTFFVRLRFLLVDIWIMQLLLRIQAISGSFAQRILSQLLEQYRALAAEYSAAVFSASTPDDFAAIFPAGEGDYIGHYEDPRVAQKRRLVAIRARRNVPHPYYPALQDKQQPAK